MPTPLETIAAAQTQADQRGTTDKAAVDTVATASQIADAIRVLVGAHVVRCNQLGWTAIRARVVEVFGEPTAAAIDAETSAIKTLWESLSPLPFPTIPADPVVEPEVTPPVQPPAPEPTV